jgi:GLPGLI family protein
MQKLVKISLLLISSLLLTIPTIAGNKDFSGTITYNITFPESNLDAQTMAMMPTTMKLTVKENMSKVEIAMAMASTVVIFNTETTSGTTLMDMMGQKFAIPLTKESIDKEAENIDSLNVQIMDETKDIAGYTCKKAVITSVQNGKESVVVAWFSEELGDGSGNVSNPMYTEIPGVLMEFSTVESGMTMKMEAVKVEKKKVSDKEFEIPPGYKEVTEEELQNMFGGGGF